jgi:CheY-specific phosphatase CheX
MHFVCDFTQKAVVAVYSTMLSLKVEPVQHREGAEMPAGNLSGMVGSVSFAGKITGAIYMTYTESLACKLTERLLGMTPKSWTEPEVTDLIGEIANMVSGDMKRRTAELGYNGLLAPPLIMQGDSIVVESKDAPICAYNLFRIPELNEELGVRVFAKLEA